MKGFRYFFLLPAALITWANIVNAECGAKCPDNLCCSKFGFCGSTPEHCGEGCDPSRGRCDGKSSPPPPPPQKQECGVRNGTPCPAGQCCSKDGRCGTTDEFCGKGCNLRYGRCKNTSTDQKCGVQNGKSCPSGQCCSGFGFCGATEAFCDKGCNKKFGKCNGPGGTPFKPGGTHATCRINGTFALTFDDGPLNFTKSLVDNLGKQDQRVTFFVNGHARGCMYDFADTLLEAMKAGHLIGAHTWSHPHLPTVSDKELKYQFLKLNEALYKITGCRPKYMRPPFGELDQRTIDLAQALDMQVIIWDVDTTDTLGSTLDQQKTIVTDFVKANPAPAPHIVLSHDAIQTTAETLAFFVLDKIEKGGWKQMPVGQCFDDDPSNWYVCDRKPTPRDNTWKCDPSDQSLAQGGTLEFEESRMILEGKARGYPGAKKARRNCRKRV